MLSTASSVLLLCSSMYLRISPSLTPMADMCYRSASSLGATSSPANGKSIRAARTFVRAFFLNDGVISGEARAVRFSLDAFTSGIHVLTRAR